MAPVSSGDVLIGVVLLVGGVVAYRALSRVAEAYDALPTPSKIVTGATDYMTTNNQKAAVQMQAYLDQKYPDQRTPAQSWVAETVQKGQDAGADSFIGSFFTGLFK